MTPTERGLLDDIIAHPADDMPRLVYADWLEDNGEEEERAEMIRRKLVGPAFMRTQALDEPLASSDAAWRRVRPCTVPDRLVRPAFDSLGVFDWPDETLVQFSCGFVHTIRCPLQAWLDHGAAVCKTHPVERVEISDREPYENAARAFLWESKKSPNPFPRAVLPDEIYMLLAGDVGLRNRNSWRAYRTREATLDALSEALLAWARKGEVE